jgi:hypothetical protein
MFISSSNHGYRGALVRASLHHQTGSGINIVFAAGLKGACRKGPESGLFFRRNSGLIT